MNVVKPQGRKTKIKNALMDLLKNGNKETFTELLKQKGISLKCDIRKATAGGRRKQKGGVDQTDRYQNYINELSQYVCEDFDDYEEADTHKDNVGVQPTPTNIFNKLNNDVLSKILDNVIKNENDDHVALLTGMNIIQASKSLSTLMKEIDMNENVRKRYFNILETNITRFVYYLTSEHEKRELNLYFAIEKENEPRQFYIQSFSITGGQRKLNYDLLRENVYSKGFYEDRTQVASNMSIPSYAYSSDTRFDSESSDISLYITPFINKVNTNIGKKENMFEAYMYFPEYEKITKKTEELKPGQLPYTMKEHENEKECAELIVKYLKKIAPGNKKCYFLTMIIDGETINAFEVPAGHYFNIDVMKLLESEAENSDIVKKYNDLKDVSLIKDKEYKLIKEQADIKKGWMYEYINCISTVIKQWFSNTQNVNKQTKIRNSVQWYDLFSVSRYYVQKFHYINAKNKNKNTNKELHYYVQTNIEMLKEKLTSNNYHLPENKHQDISFSIINPCDVFAFLKGEWEFIKGLIYDFQEFTEIYNQVGKTCDGNVNNKVYWETLKTVFDKAYTYYDDQSKTNWNNMIKLQNDYAEARNDVALAIYTNMDNILGKLNKSGGTKSKLNEKNTIKIKRTNEKVIIKGKQRSVYIGVRGGKYIKVSGKYVRLQNNKIN